MSLLLAPSRGCLGLCWPILTFPLILLPLLSILFSPVLPHSLLLSNSFSSFFLYYTHISRSLSSYPFHSYFYPSLSSTSSPYLLWFSPSTPHFYALHPFLLFLLLSIPSPFTLSLYSSFSPRIASHFLLSSPYPSLLSSFSSSSPLVYRCPVLTPFGAMTLVCSRGIGSSF